MNVSLGCTEGCGAEVRVVLEEHGPGPGIRPYFTVESYDADCDHPQDKEILADDGTEVIDDEYRRRKGLL